MHYLSIVNICIHMHMFECKCTATQNSLHMYGTAFPSYSCAVPHVLFVMWSMPTCPVRGAVDLNPPKSTSLPVWYSHREQVKDSQRKWPCPHCSWWQVGRLITEAKTWLKLGNSPGDWINIKTLLVTNCWQKCLLHYKLCIQLCHVII